MSQARFNLKSHKQDPALILLVYRVRGERLVYSTGMHVPLKYWDVARGRVKSPHLYRPGAALNDLLGKIADTVELFHVEGMAAGGWNFEELRRRLDRVTLRLSEERAPAVTEFIRLNIEQRAGTAKHSTVQMYRTMLSHLVGFEKLSRVRLEFKDVDMDFFYSWCDYLFGRGLAGNTVSKTIKRLKTFLSEAESRGISVPPAYKSGRFRVATTPSTHIYLTEEDLSLIEAAQVEPRLEKVRDLLLVGCRTGLRVSDWGQIAVRNIRTTDGVRVLSVQPAKTGQPVFIPLHPVVARVLAKYGGEMPVISQQKFNEYVKELAHLAGVKEWARVSSHTCRRTFATLAYKAGLPLLSIAKITGHSSERVLLAYIRVSGEENAVMASKNPFFNEG